MDIKVLKTDGSDSGKTVSLATSIFQIDVNEQVMYEAVRQYLAHQRQGTAKTKGRSEVSRTSKKAFRQKGTGGARRGSYRSPIVKGGGTVFGPQPRTYTIGLNKKMRILARNSALTLKAAEQAIMVTEDLSFDSPSTKSFNALLDSLAVNGKKVLVLTSDINKNLYLSARNLPKSNVLPVSDLNTYGIMNSDVLVFTETALENLQASETIEVEA